MGVLKDMQNYRELQEGRRKQYIQKDLSKYEWDSATANREMNPLPDFCDGDDDADNR
jgi:hypothetical protein